MSTKKPRLTQAQKAARPKLARLKKLGLFKGRVHRPSRHGIKQTGVFAQVLSKKAAVVSVPRSKLKQYSEAFTVRGGKVVLPKIEGERYHYDKKAGAIVSTRTQHGQRIRKTVLPVPSVANLGDVPLGPNRYYVLPLGQNFHVREKTMKAIKAFVFEYEQRYKRRYRNWQKYVVIEEIIGGDSGDYGERVRRT